VSPVPGEEHVLREAIRGHEKNWRCTDEADFIQYVDDESPATGLSPGEAGPFRKVNRWLEAAKRGDSERPVPTFFIVSGWFDTSASCALRLAHHLKVGGHPTQPC
jgi:hypothetical protein